MLFHKNEIKITKPKPLEEVDLRFSIQGTISIALLTKLKERRGRFTLSVDLIDIKGQTILGTDLDISTLRPLYPPNRNYVRFYSTFQIYEQTIWSVIESKGRMVIKLSHNPLDNKEALYIPITVKGYTGNSSHNKEAAAWHKNLGKTIKKYQKDLEKFNKKFLKIAKSRTVKNNINKEGKIRQFSDAYDWRMSTDILKIFDDSEETLNGYAYTKEDIRQKKLEEKYKDALEWQGPVLGAGVGRVDGYEFRVYYDDHDQHFHVIHKGKGIDARFDFPSIQLRNYKRSIGKTISSKHVKKIQDYFKDPKNFNRLKAEFDKRSLR